MYDLSVTLVAVATPPDRPHDNHHASGGGGASAARGRVAPSGSKRGAPHEGVAASRDVVVPCANHPANATPDRPAREACPLRGRWLPATLVVGLLAVPSADARAADPVDVYHQVTGVEAIQGRVRLWTTRPVEVELPPKDGFELPDRFQYGIRVDFERITRNSVLVPPADLPAAEEPEPAGSLLAAIAFSPAFGEEKLFRTLYDHVVEQVRALDGQPFRYTWAGLDHWRLFHGDAVRYGEDPLGYVLLQCEVAPGGTPTARLWSSRYEEGRVTRSPMTRLNPSEAAPACEALRGEFRGLPEEIESPQTPLEIQGRLLRGLYVERSGAASAVLPEATTPAWERVEEMPADAARPPDDERQRGELYVSGFAHTPDTAIEPESLAVVRGVLARFTVLETVQNFAGKPTREETELESAVAGFFPTAGRFPLSPESLSYVVARSLSASSTPLAVGDVAEALGGAIPRNVYAVVCLFAASGEPTARYFVGRASGNVLNPEPVCDVLDREVERASP